MNSLILAATLTLLGGPVCAGEVSVSLKPLGAHRYELEGRFTAPVSRETAWAVLTDYANIPAFVPSMRHSRIKERVEGSTLLEQESVGTAFIFSHTVRVLLKVREEPLQRISFQDTANLCFESYEGEWRLEDAPGEGTAVAYRLKVVEGPALPRFVPKSVVR